MTYIEQFEAELLKKLDGAEDTAYRNRGRKVVVLCDRGTMDGEAYCSPGAFAKMIGQFGFNHRQICDERYHGVIHLRTAALGAEKYYTLANNETRKESLEDARTIDQLTLEAWQRHSHPRVVDNSTGFKGKLSRLFAEICSILGDPVPVEIEESFLVKPVDLENFPVRWNQSLITQDYLVTPRRGEEHRIRTRTDDGGTSYYYTVKRYVGPGERAEEEKMITRGEYDSLHTLRDPAFDTIRKRRICFFWNEQFFELDHFIWPRAGLHRLEAEKTNKRYKLVIPPFIRVIRAVTGQKRYSNRAIAKRK